LSAFCRVSVGVGNDTFGSVAYRLIFAVINILHKKALFLPYSAFFTSDGLPLAVNLLEPFKLFVGFASAVYIGIDMSVLSGSGGISVT
jgi:hypothetical protein